MDTLTRGQVDAALVGICLANGFALPERMTTPEAAAYIGRSEVWLKKYRHDVRTPTCERHGKRVFYALEELDHWLQHGAPSNGRAPAATGAHPYDQGPGRPQSNP